MRSSRPRLRPPVARPRPTESAAATDAPVYQPIAFSALPLSPDMHQTVAEIGYTTATPIQAASIPIALQGRDLIGQAHTGSGKTAAFGIPMIERLDPEGPPVQGLVLCPTRELAVQVHEEITRLAERHPVSSVAIFGGDSMNRQLDELRRGPQILVATPGRLSDHLQRRSVSLGQLRIAVLDEADRMLDMGFAPDVEKILRQSPASRQTLLFSATMPDWVKRLAMRHMHDPEMIAISERPEIAEGVRQLYVETSWSDKLDVVTRILDQPDVTLGLIFVETKRTADILESQLKRRGYSVGLLHGDLSQKDRTAAMQQFANSGTKFLIATNVAARGLDVDDISHVINYDVPTTPDEYLHRVGRTARAGRTGVAITLITPSEILKLRDVERHAQTTIERAELDDFPARQPSG